MITIHPTSTITGEVKVPGDKSISQRAILLASLAKGDTFIKGWLSSGDTRATLQAMRALGVAIQQKDENSLVVQGKISKRPTSPLNLVHSGTGFRLLSGILSGQPFPSIIDGSSQLRNRPMARIIHPLQDMGANIISNHHHSPLKFTPSALQGITHNLKIPSAQVKSAILLAGLFAKEPTTLIHPYPTRNHTEIMLKQMGANITWKQNQIILNPDATLHGTSFHVPGDFSSASFLIVATLLTRDSFLKIHGVNLNPTRTGLLDVLKQMGGQIDVNFQEGNGELTGTITVQSSSLKGIFISGDKIIRMIDEVPIFMIAALQAKGQTVVKDAQELRVKESDRIKVMILELEKMGATIQEKKDGFILSGKQKLIGATVSAHEDHRVAMSLAVASLVTNSPSKILGASSVGDSFPNFFQQLARLGVLVEFSGEAQ